MPLRPLAFTIALTLLTSLLTHQPTQAADAFTPGFTSAGFAEVDISPTIGMEKPGNYHKIFFNKFFDPCKVRAAVFGQDSNRVALVAIDALIIREPQVIAARKRIAKLTGIKPSAILIGASHSHSSGPVGMVLPGEYDHASPLVQELAYQKSSMADPAYLTQVVDGLVNATIAADQNRAPLKCAVGSGIEADVAINRRYRMTNGLTYTHPRQGNPNILESAGPIDPEVGVIGAWNNDGELVGCIVNYACHATAGPPGISANWIYHLEKTIRAVLGENVIVVFLQGACGDITQVDNLSAHARPTGTQASKIVGGSVGAEAVKVLLKTELAAGALTPLVSKQTFLKIPRRVPSNKHLADALALVQQKLTAANKSDWTFAKETVMLDALITKEPIRSVEVQAIQLGPAVFLTNPAEYFCQLGLDIKAGSPFPFTFPVELANGCIGYVPTTEALSPTGGGYETRLTSYSNLAPTAGDQLAQAAIQLANSLKPGPIPTPKPAPPFTAPWSYGNVPPQTN